MYNYNKLSFLGTKIIGAAAGLSLSLIYLLARFSLKNVYNLLSLIRNNGYNPLYGSIVPSYKGME